MGAPPSLTGGSQLQVTVVASISSNLIGPFGSSGLADKNGETEIVVTVCAALRYPGCGNSLSIYRRQLDLGMDNFIYFM